MSKRSIEWLRKLALEGRDGVVGNIDARAIGCIAKELELLYKALEVGVEVIEVHAPVATSPLVQDFCAYAHLILEGRVDYEG